MQRDWGGDAAMAPNGKASRQRFFESTDDSDDSDDDTKGAGAASGDADFIHVRRPNLNENSGPTLASQVADLRRREREGV